MLINRFREALESIENRFSKLKNATVKRDSQGNIEINCKTYFAEVYIEWNGMTHLLSMPIKRGVMSRVEMIALRARNMRSSSLLPYIILHDEFHYCVGNQVKSVDLVLCTLPSTTTLRSVVREVDAEKIYSGIDHLNREFLRLGIAHNYLNCDNIIVDKDCKLYPIYYHYMTMYQGACQVDEFSPLRQWVEEVTGISYICHNNEPHLPERSSSLNSKLLDIYSWVGNPFEGLVCVCSQDGMYGYVDSDDYAEVIAPCYIWANDFKEGRAEVKLESGRGMIDHSGEYIIPPKYQIVDFDVDTGYSRVKSNEQWAIFDYNGVVICDFSDNRNICTAPLRELISVNI